MVDAQDDGGFRAINAGNYSSMAGSSGTPGTPDVEVAPEKSAPVVPAPTHDGSPTDALSQVQEISLASVTNLSPPMGVSAQPSSQATTTTEQPLRPHSTLPTAMALTSSAPSAQDAGSAAQLPTYGTRSRNRPGKPRINYAEDVDVDFEYSVPAINTTVERYTSSSERTSRSPLTGDSRQSPTVSSTKNSVAGMLKGVQKVFPQLTKESPIPGMSTFSANPNGHTPPTAPKKRKNAANHGNHTSQTTSVASAHLSAKRTPFMQALSGPRETNMLTFEKSKAILKNGKLVADDGTIVAVNDTVYLVCEPPGDPYYLCRIMEFICAEGDKTSSPVTSLRVNWFYRPRDISRFSNDTRLVYWTMHSDTCPITSLRGKCRILHRSEIDDLEEYRKAKDSFWFNQCFDRFIHRYYEVVPTSQVINVPEKVKKALDENWKYIVVETNRMKELTSAVKSCKRCVGYCATNDSVECAVCHNTYHMDCVRPPLLKKPSRGFAWACGPCSRAQERKLEARRTPIVGDVTPDGEEEEVFEEEEEDAGALVPTTAPSPSGSDIQPGTQAELALVKMWPGRYLGIHCRVEDALQYDDRAIYPRASSRLGPRHQSNVDDWFGRPVELVKPVEIKKRYVKSTSHKKDAKLSKETVAALEADRAEKATRPKWVQDEPPGYVQRGEDYPNNDPGNTAKLLFKMPPAGVYSSRGDDAPDAPDDREELVKSYMERAKALAKDVGVHEYSVDFLDKAVQLLQENNYNAQAALKQLKKVDRHKDLGIPEPSKEEFKRFEEAVAKYGSEWRLIRQHVKTMSHADVVRFYYMWKKSPKAREIKGSHSGRKIKTKNIDTDAASRLLDDVADDHDDSAFDNDKAASRKRGFQCKFCETRQSRQWRRAPGVAPGQTVPGDNRGTKDKSSALVLALCQRCAYLWRKYAIQWEEIEELTKKVAQSGGRTIKKRFDQELIDAALASKEEREMTNLNARLDYSATPPVMSQSDLEPPKKKARTAPEKQSTPQAAPSEPVQKPKPLPPPRPPTPPIVPALPKFRELPCRVCKVMGTSEEPTIMCTICRLTVHGQCYGVTDSQRPNNKWHCDTCRNDRQEVVSFKYECVLCPVKRVEQDLVEAPKVSHKKKTDREREKERLEKELATKFAEDYRQGQLQKGRPDVPREPLKRTADNNWVHVHCAVWTPGTSFSNAEALELVEGIGSPQVLAMYGHGHVCKVCKSDQGPLTKCKDCDSTFHIGCAHVEDYSFGFDITPVKSTRRDAVSTFTLGTETGSLHAAIWCKEHKSIKTIVHPVFEVVPESGLNALQLYVQNYKQADLTLTGTARKANLVDQSTRSGSFAPAPATTGNNRRTSTAHTGNTALRSQRPSSAGLKPEDQESMTGIDVSLVERRCVTCNIDVTPKWWRVDESSNTDGVKTKPTSSSGSAPSGINPANSIAMELHDRDVGGSHIPNGLTDYQGDPSHTSLDAAAAAAVPAHAPLENDTETTQGQPDTFVCNKCHWKKLHEPELQEANRSESQESLTQQPSGSPQRLYPPSQLPWIPPANIPPPPVHPPSWPSHGPSILNGISTSPQPLAHPPLQQPYHLSLHTHPPPNGYPSFPPPGGPPPGTMRGSPFPPPHHQPAPLHLSNSPMIGGLPNGMHSPHMPMISPTYGPPTLPPRNTDSPYSASSGPHLPPFGHSHGSPAPLNTRPSTPRDSVLSQNADRRPMGGASASPSLSNLLH